MTFKSITEEFKLGIKDISDKFDIPYRTVQNWSNGTRKAPEYVIKMMYVILKNNLL